jgi:hypothetical protein
MEIFRAFGIEQELHAAALPAAALAHVRWVRSLAGAEVGRLDVARKPGDLSPTRVVSCAQIASRRSCCARRPRAAAGCASAPSSSESGRTRTA